MNNENQRELPKYKCQAFMRWDDIANAPTDGRPVWVTGWDFGKIDGTRHYCWAYFHGDRWNEAGIEKSELLYLTHYALL